MPSHSRLARAVSYLFFVLLTWFVIAMSACGSSGGNSGNGSSAGNSGGAPGTSGSNPGGTSSGGSGGASGSGGGGGSATPTPQGGTYVYARLSGGGVGGYRMNADGSLTALAGSPFAVSGDALAAAGTHLFSVGQSQLVVYGIDAQTGSLTAESQAAVPAGSMVAASGGFVYAMSTPSAGGSNIYAFTVAQNGTLTPVAGSPFTHIAGPCDLCVKSLSMTVDARYLAIGDGFGPHGAGGFDLYTRQSNGAVQRTSAASASSITSIALNAADSFLYTVQSGDDSILVSSIDANGQMKVVQDLLPPENFFAGAVPDAGGKYVVAVSQTKLISYAGGSDGKLTAQASTVQTASNTFPATAVFDPSGHFVVLANSSGLATFSFNQSSGALAPAGTAASGTAASSPVAVAF